MLILGTNRSPSSTTQSSALGSFSHLALKSPAYRGVAGTVFCLGSESNASVAGAAEADDIVAIWILDRLFTEPTDQLRHAINQDDNSIETIAAPNSPVTDPVSLMTVGQWVSAVILAQTKWMIKPHSNPRSGCSPEVLRLAAMGLTPCKDALTAEAGMW